MTITLLPPGQYFLVILIASITNAFFTKLDVWVGCVHDAVGADLVYTCIHLIYFLLSKELVCLSEISR